MFFLYFVIACLILSMFAVSACCVQLASEDPQIRNWVVTRTNTLHEWVRMYIVRYRHAPRHTPQHIERKRAECKLSYVLQAT